MIMIEPDTITKIRSASRDLVRELGFMGQTIAGTDLSASAVHAIIETGLEDQLSAKGLSEKLCLEKSTVSRLVKSLVARGDLTEIRSEKDNRVKYLHLTEQGRGALATITRFGEQQVAGAIKALDPFARQTILTGLQSYSQALKSNRRPQGKPHSGEEMQLHSGYAPGLIGRVVSMHATYYSRETGFGEVFEAKVAKGLADFMPRLNHSENGLWHIRKHGRIVGNVAIDGEELGEGKAQLRWFIVDDGCRGAGLGRKLIEKAVEFCDERGFEETHLWTLKGLEAAQKLYEDCGFVLTDEYYGEQWGRNVLEQEYVRLSSKRADLKCDIASGDE